MTWPSRPLGTREVAKRCHVSVAAVTKWIRQGKLKAFSTPGGHYRILEDDLQVFAQQTGIPIFREEIREPVAKEWKILVVDDDPAILDLVSTALEKVEEDYRIRAADNGYDAGTLAATWEPDLLILDLVMPGLNGFEVCERLSKKKGTRPKILAITGFSTEENVAKALVAGAEACLTKPFTATEVIGHVRELLGIATEPTMEEGIMEKDRRSTPRLKANFPVKIEKLRELEEASEGLTTNVSGGGFQVKSALRAETGDEVSFEVGLPPFDLGVKVKAQCRWCSELKGSDGVFLKGLEFVERREGDVNLLLGGALLEGHRSGSPRANPSAELQDSPGKGVAS